VTIEKLERVMWRLRKRHPDASSITNLQLKRAIMYECGTDPTTFRNNRKALKDLGWIKPVSRKSIKLTDADIRGEE